MPLLQHRPRNYPNAVDYDRTVATGSTLSYGKADEPATIQDNPSLAVQVRGTSNVSTPSAAASDLKPPWT